MERAIRTALLACGVLTAVACRDDVAGPTRPSYMTYYGCEMDPACSGGGGGGGGGGGFATDPNPSAAGYWMGTTVTPSTCISPTGTNINDVDYDGLNDYCENLLAMRFRPALTFSAYDCKTGMEPYWAAKVFPNQGNTVRIAYLLSYYLDCGLQDPRFFPDDPGCAIFADCGPHHGDSEFITEDLHFDSVSQHWYVYRAFLSAHWGLSSGAGPVSTAGLLYPEKVGGYPLIYSSEGKHANYVSQSTCNSGGTFGSDTCEGNPNTGTQIRHSEWYNVGSLQANLINPGTCVGAESPWQPGTECYWVRGRNFLGWYDNVTGDPPTPYYTILYAKFECHSYPRRVGFFPNGQEYYYATLETIAQDCTDWGINRKSLQ